MEATKGVLLFGLGVILCITSQAGAYPAAGGKDAPSCSDCHSNDKFAEKAVFQLINKRTKENVVKGDTAYIPIKQGDSESYKLVLGSNGATSVQAKTIGWMFVLPGGVRTELPNCIRLLNAKQKFRYKKEVAGKIVEENDNLTVATQTFFFDGNAGNFAKQLPGELRTAMGVIGKGQDGLGETVFKLIFVP